MSHKHMQTKKVREKSRNKNSNIFQPLYGKQNALQAYADKKKVREKSRE